MPDIEPKIIVPPEKLIVKCILPDNHTLEFMTTQHSREEINKVFQASLETPFIFDAEDEVGGAVNVGITPSCVLGWLIIAYDSMQKMALQQRYAEAKARGAVGIVQ